MNDAADNVPEKGTGREDVDLIQHAKDGDEDAFRELVRRHEARVFVVARQMVGDEDDARDVCQEVFLALHRSLRRFVLRGKLSTWLYRVTLNASIDFQRKRARIEKAEGEAPRLSVWSGDQDLRMTLDRVLQELSDRQRSAFVMRDLQGLELDEVARILGCGSVTVRVHLHNARRRVRAMMREEL